MTFLAWIRLLSLPFSSILLAGTAAAVPRKPTTPSSQIGFKPAGGIRSAKDSLAWLSLIKEELGDEWLTPELFRIGASALLSDIERQIYHHVTGRYAAYHDLPMC